MEKLIVEYLQIGLTQSEITERLKQDGIKPNSLSSVEKKLKQIKKNYEAKTMFHLACILYNKKVLKITDSHNCD